MTTYVLELVLQLKKGLYTRDTAKLRKFLNGYTKLIPSASILYKYYINYLI